MPATQTDSNPKSGPAPEAAARRRRLSRLFTGLFLLTALSCSVFPEADLAPVALYVLFAGLPIVYALELRGAQNDSIRALLRLILRVALCLAALHLALYLAGRLANPIDRMWHLQASLAVQAVALFPALLLVRPRLDALLVWALVGPGAVALLRLVF